MKHRLYWLVAGGLSFWLPAIVINVALDQKSNLWTLNVVPLASLALLGATSWLCTKHLPKWGWVLSGIYVLGPISTMAPSVFLHAPSSPSTPGGNFWVVLICLFPPMTLWISLLNGMLFSVLIATVALPFLAVYLRSPAKNTTPNQPMTTSGN